MLDLDWVISPLTLSLSLVIRNPHPFVGFSVPIVSVAILAQAFAQVQGQIQFQLVPCFIDVCAYLTTCRFAATPVIIPST